MSSRTKEYPIYPQDATRPLLEKYEFFIKRVRPKITLKTIQDEEFIAPKIVSHLLNGYAELGQPLARSNLIKIIKVLARRNAIRSRDEAEEFLQIAAQIAGFDGTLSEENEEDKQVLALLPVPHEETSHIWNVPYLQNQYFTGREEILTRLHDNLSSKKPIALTQPHAISGLGGIGKTQIAI